jgi:hypothetical protein
VRQVWPFVACRRARVCDGSDNFIAPIVAFGFGPLQGAVDGGAVTPSSPAVSGGFIPRSAISAIWSFIVAWSAGDQPKIDETKISVSQVTGRCAKI